jgi:hypothetical protein
MASVAKPGFFFSFISSECYKLSIHQAISSMARKWLGEGLSFSRAAQARKNPGFGPLWERQFYFFGSS